MVVATTKTLHQETCCYNYFLRGWGREHALVGRSGGGGLGAPRRDPGAAAGGAGLAAASRRGADPLRVLRPGDALGVAGANPADDLVGGADELDSASALARGATPGGPRAGGAVPLPRGRPRHQRPA